MTSVLMFCTGLICSLSVPVSPMKPFYDLGYTHDEISMRDEATIQAVQSGKESYRFTKEYKTELSNSESDLSLGSRDASFKDDYRTIDSLITETSKGKYHFYGTSKWNKMPYNRGVDSFSICADGIVPVFSSAIGYITDTCEVHTPKAKPLINSEKKEISQSDLKLYSFQNSSGIGYLYDLPDNKTIVQVEYIYSDFQFHLSFDAQLHYPSQDQYFNVYAINDHYEWAPQINASLSFSTKGGCLGIGLSSNWQTHRRFAVTQNPIHYEA